MQARYEEGTEYVTMKYIKLIDPIDHIMNCNVTWRKLPIKEWLHLFIHTLDTIPKNLYT